MNVEYINFALKTVLGQITTDRLAHENMQLSQAALNLVHVLGNYQAVG